MPLDKQNFNYSIPLSAPTLSSDSGLIVGDTVSSGSITTGKILYSANGTTYIPVSPSTVSTPGALYQPTAPTNPGVGQIWIDSSSNNTNYDPNLVRRKTIVATGGQQAFIADLAFTDGYEQVFLNGLLLTRNTDYTTTSSIQVNLVVPAVVNDVIDILSVTNLNSVSGSTATTTTNTFTGTQTFTPSNAAIIPVTINGAFNQTADLLDINNYSTNNLFKIDAYGRIIVGNTYAAQNQNYLTVQNTTATGMYPWEAANLAIRDSRPLSASVGGGIIFEGNYQNTYPSIAAFAGIKGTKFNTTSGDVKGFLDLWSRGGGGIRMFTAEQVVGSESASPAIQIGVAGDTYLKGYNPTVSFTMSAYNDTSKQQIIVADNEWTKFYSLAPGAGSHLFYGGTVTNGTSGATLRMWIDGNNCVMIGYSTNNNTAYKLQVNSQIFATSSSIATSDEKYKENIKTLDGGLGIVKSLRPVEFDWKKQKDIKDKNGKMLREGHNFVEGKTIGFVAQEVQKAIKSKKWADNIVKSNSREAIKDENGDIIAEEETFLGLAETHLIPILVSAIQELTARLEKLEDKK
jgi:hypothetical protein